MIEVTDAAIDQGFDRQGASELLAKLAKRLENEKPALGYDITECYDLLHHRPAPHYEKAYVSTKEQLMKMGLKLM